MQTAQPYRKARQRAGFSLLELMVALTVGGVALSSIYAIGAAGAKQFRYQQQMASLQGSLRRAHTLVKRDLARAGYLATPSASAPPNKLCGVTSPYDTPLAGGRLAGVSRFDNDISPAPTAIDLASQTTNRANGFTVDRVTLFGNYVTSAEYSGIRLVTNSSIELPWDWHNFRRDFTQWYADAVSTLDSTAFANAFVVNRLIRIRTTTGRLHFAQVTGVTAVSDLTTGNPVISFTPAIPGSCVGEVNGGWVAPVSAIRYSVANATNGAEVERFAGAEGIVGQLVREEVLPTTKAPPVAPLPPLSPPRVMLDFVVGFNLRFAMNGASVPGQPEVVGTVVPNAADAAGALVNNNPERIRRIALDLMARAPAADESLLFSSGICANARCFKVPPVPPATSSGRGAARVRRLRGEVLVPNIAFEGY